LYGSTVDRVLSPGASRRHVLNLLQLMRQPRPAVKGKAAATGNAGTTGATGTTGTQLADLLVAADSVMKRRSLVFVVSDFISAPGWEQPLARLARRHEVVAVRLFDPLEMALPEHIDGGLVTVEDAETGEQLFIDAADPGFRERYARIAEERETALFEALAESGADTLDLATDDDLLETLMRYADLRRQRARLKTPRRFPAAFQRASAGAAINAAEGREEAAA